MITPHSLSKSCRFLVYLPDQPSLLFYLQLFSSPLPLLPFNPLINFLTFSPTPCNDAEVPHGPPHSYREKGERNQRRTLWVGYSPQIIALVYSEQVIPFSGGPSTCIIKKRVAEAPVNETHKAVSNKLLVYHPKSLKKSERGGGFYFYFLFFWDKF